MSFASEVKNEIISFERAVCCQSAMNYGLLLFARSFSKDSISLLTENESVANAFADASFSLCEEKAPLQMSDAGKYKVNIENSDIIIRILTALGYDSKSFKKRINFANIPDSCCFSAFAAGAFLACGTVTDPDKEYHLEFSVSTKGLCDDLVKIFDEFEIHPKTTVRSGAYVVYIKNSNDIEELLTRMGATETAMQLMGSKMLKDIRNTVNRKVNFENANLARTVVAATKQYDAIAKLVEKSGLDSLPEQLREIARLRLEDREMSSAEIAKILPESISVSGVNHRFRKLIKMAEELEK